MKKNVFKAIFTLTVMGLLVCGICSCNEDEDEKGKNGGDGYTPADSEGYVDLGLPSGTCWKAENEENAADAGYDFYTFDEAYDLFYKDHHLPNANQCRELISECEWTWDKKGYRVVGPNGNSIFVPAAGKRECEGEVNGIGNEGFYWSSDTNYWNSGLGFCFFFTSGNQTTGFISRCIGASIRLVKK